jgi:hypothetical protein
MVGHVVRIGRRILLVPDISARRNAWRFTLLALLLLGLVLPTDLRDLIISAMGDAYLQVTVFVAATLALIYGLEKAFNRDLGKFLERQGLLQAPLSAFLGALPGCGGAIVVVTQYVRGYVSFGSVVAVLVATMGDAAFLLLAREPTVGLFALGFTVGSLTGWFVDWLHGTDFMRAAVTEKAIVAARKTHDLTDDERVSGFTWIDIAWLGLLVPSIALGLMIAFQQDTDWLFGPLAGHEPTRWLGLTGALLSIVMWVLAGHQNTHNMHDAVEIETIPVWRRIIQDTNFITVWVVVGFLVYEIGIHIAGTGIEHFFKVWAPLVPLMGVVVGFLPGCGPQIVVTTLYLAGLVPLSAQIGNAISNDGDALFPAIALAPKAAILATLYSGIPAILFAYAWYFILE